MSAAVDAQAVPLGGRRVPEGMDDHADWQNLPLAPQPREPQDFGAVHTAVMRFRSELGDIKKLLTAVAPAVKGLIYATDAGNDEEVNACKLQMEEQLEKVSARSKAVCSSLPSESLAAAEESRTEGWLSDETKEKVASSTARAAQVLEEVVNDSIELCRNCLEGPSDSAKDRFGDFSLKLNSHTRKLFSEQGKLMDVMKAIRKEKEREHSPVVAAQEDDAPN